MLHSIEVDPEFDALRRKTGVIKLVTFMRSIRDYF